MKLYVNPSVTMDTLDNIARDMGIEAYTAGSSYGGDNGIMQRGKFKGRRKLIFSLRPDKSQPKVEGTRSKRWQMVRESPFYGYSKGAMGVRGDGRRNVHAVCWHGHWEYMMRVFDIDPHATFQTAVDMWDGVEDFLARAEMSGHKNIGSMIAPLQYREACDCDVNGGYLIRTHRNSVAA